MGTLGLETQHGPYTPSAAQGGRAQQGESELPWLLVLTG